MLKTDLRARRSCFEWRFVRSQTVDVALESAAYNLPHGLHTMEISQRISATPLVFTLNLCARGGGLGAAACG